MSKSSELYIPPRVVSCDEQVWLKCSEEDYTYGLECLYPASWLSHGFLVGEAWTHDHRGIPAFQAFITVNGQQYKGLWPMTAGEFAKFKGLHRDGNGK